MDIRGLRFTDLSQSEEELFVKWFDLFAKKDKYNELYIQLHLSIKNGDDSELTNKEREMLNTLFESQKINRENILYYYRLFTLISGFKEVIVENIPFFEKFDYVSIDKVVNSYIQTLNEEDKSIIKKNYLYVRDEIIRLVVEERLLLLLTAHMFNEAEEFYVSYGTLYSEHKYRELKNKYLNEKKELVKKELSELLNRSCFEDFKTKIEGNNKFFTKTEIDSLQKKYDERFALYVFNCIEAHINNIEFEQANIVLKLNENILNAEQLLELKLLYEKKLIKHVEESIQQIEILIQHDNFEEAVIFYNNNAYVLSSCNLKKEVLEYITHIKKWNAVVSELELFDFNQSDLTVNNYFNYDFNKNGYYEGTKSYFIREYFKNYFSQEKMPFLIDEEQAKAISIQNENILVTARAGSGKTRVIVAKILYLLETKGFSWDSILVLAFNRNVPLEIQDRLQHQVLLNSYPDKYKKIDVAQTFHKVARSYSDYRGEILANKKTHFIRLVIEYLKENDNSFSERVYNFFRKENHTIEKKAYRDPEDYYTVIRSSKLRTLNGEYVKSKGEKWIADFLFEHGIQYEYEREFFLQYLFQNKDVLSFNEDLKLRLKPFIGEREKTIPDFYLPDFNLLIEHWGINENEESEDEYSGVF